MKQKIWSIALIAVMSVFITSCGVSRRASYVNTASAAAPAANPGGIGVKKAKSEAQLYAEDPNATTIRAWAQYNGFAEDDLEGVAANLARQELSNTIAALVTGAIEDYAERHRIQSQGADGTDKRMVLSQSTEETVSTVTQELIRGSKVAVSDRYMLNDGTETAYVCVELDPELLLNNMVNNAKLKEAISQNEKLQIDKDREDFKASMESQIELLNERKAQGE